MNAHSAIGTRAVAITAVVIIIVVGIGIISLTSHSNTSTSSSASPPTTVQGSSSTTETMSVANSNGLEFMMALKSSSLSRKGSLKVSLELYNTLDKVNNVTGAQDWRLTSQSESACAKNDPFRTEVLRGYYDSGNYSKGAPVVFAVIQPLPGPNQCLFFIQAANDNAQPLFVGSENQNRYDFSPMSDKAQWISSDTNQLATMGETVVLEPSLFSNSTGVFTVVSGDMWGDIQVAHFVV